MHTWCAWDPMFLAPIVGDAEVETHDPVTGETIRYRVGDDGIHDLSHHGFLLTVEEAAELGRLHADRLRSGAAGPGDPEVATVPA